MSTPAEIAGPLAIARKQDPLFNDFSRARMRNAQEVERVRPSVVRAAGILRWLATTARLIAVAGVDGGVLAGWVSIIAGALPPIITVPLLGLRAHDCAGRSADDCARRRAARSACQQAAEYAAEDSASDCPADRPLAGRRRRRTRRRRCISDVGRRRRDLFDRWICIFNI